MNRAIILIVAPLFLIMQGSVIFIGKQTAAGIRGITQRIYPRCISPRFIDGAEQSYINLNFRVNLYAGIHTAAHIFGIIADFHPGLIGETK